MSDHKIHLGVYGILQKDGEILVIKKARGPYVGMFDLPGGRMKFGETIQECLARECLEETGCPITPLKFFDISEFYCQYKKRKATFLKGGMFAE